MIEGNGTVITPTRRNGLEGAGTVITPTTGKILIKSSEQLEVPAFAGMTSAVGGEEIPAFAGIGSGNLSLLINQFPLVGVITNQVL